MAGAKRDPFAAPDAEEVPLELAATLPRRPPSVKAAAVDEPMPRPPVKHPKPPGGASNLLLWTFAAIGVVALGAGGVWLWQREAARRAAEAGPKPVVWHPIPRTGDVLVTIELSPRPPHARLLLDGDPLPSNPVLLPRGSTHRLNVTADGFEPEELELTADAAKTIRLPLLRAR